MRNLKTSTVGHGRQAITGIVIALIVFATLFSVGVGYYLYAGQASLVSAQGALARQGNVQGANAESLTVSAASGSSSECTGCVLAVNVYNSGGILATITAVYVTTTSGKALSSSTNPSSLGSEFLTVGNELTGDLNVTLPVSLAVGEGTGSLTGCGASVGCAIGIRSTSCVNCLTSGNVYVSILTSRGNTFSAQYCPSTCSSGAGQTFTNTITSATTATSYSTSFISTTTTLYGETSSTAISGFQAGTNSLIVSMRACAGTTSPGQAYGANCASPQPPAVYTSEEVILQINVTNYANFAMNVYVDFQNVTTSGSYVTQQSSSTTPSIPSGADNCVGWTAPTKSINPNQEQTYTCTFITTQGTAGGTVTFLGYAVGTYSSGYVTSAEVLSNPLEIGNPLSSIAGPFVGLSFEYAAQGSTSIENPAVVVSNSLTDVVWNATLENTANASVTILEYSFLLVARVAQEHDFYIVQPVSLPISSSSLSTYTCALGTGNAPTGAQCSTPQTNCAVLGNGCVPTGATVKLYFAATDISGTGWEWGNGGGFSPPEAVTMFVIIEYDYYNAGVWHVLAQAVPFTGTYFTS